MTASTALRMGSGACRLFNRRKPLAASVMPPAAISAIPVSNQQGHKAQHPHEFALVAGLFGKPLQRPVRSGADFLTWRDIWSAMRRRMSRRGPGAPLRLTWWSMHNIRSMLTGERVGRCSRGALGPRR
jgi:hypothetical protein